MSKTELLLSKLRNISVLVSIGAFVFFVIDLLFAVINDAIDCSGDQLLCTIGSEHVGFKTTLWMLFVIMMVFLVLARVLDFILQRESKLLDVNEYRESLVKKEELSFSQTKIYSDIIKTKKSRYTDLSSDGGEEDVLEEEADVKEEVTSARERTRERLPFFARKKLEEAMKDEDEKTELIKDSETDTLEEIKPKQPFMNKVKEINWKFWKKEKLDSSELAEEAAEIQEEKDQAPKKPFMDKVKEINWKFWEKEKLESVESTEETDEIQEEKDKTPKKPFMEKVKEINWAFWVKEKTEIDTENEEEVDTDKEPKKPFMDKIKEINWAFWKKEKTEITDEFEGEIIEDDQSVKPVKKSVKSKGSKMAADKEKSKTQKVDIIDKSEKEKEFYTRLNKGELIEIVAESTELSKVKARLVINTMLDIIVEQVKKDDEVKIGKFGRFKRVAVKASNDVDPNTGKRVKIEEGFTVNFYPDKVFKDMITDDVSQTTEKYLLTKKVMRNMTETQVEEELYKEEKIHEHVDLKVVQSKEFVKEEKVVKEKPIVKEVKKEPVIEEKPVIIQEKKVEVKPEVKAETPKPKKQKVSVLTKTKADLIETIFETTGISKNKSNKFLGVFGKVITEELANGGDVELTGIGTMTTIVMPAKEAVNPQTKQKIIVPEHRQVRMRFNEDYKDKFS